MVSIIIAILIRVRLPLEIWLITLTIILTMILVSRPIIPQTIDSRRVFVRTTLSTYICLPVIFEVVEITKKAV